MESVFKGMKIRYGDCEMPRKCGPLLASQVCADGRLCELEQQHELVWLETRASTSTGKCEFTRWTDLDCNKLVKDMIT